MNFFSPACLFLRFTRGRVPLRRAVYVSSDAHQRDHLPAVFPLSFWARYAQSKLRATTFFLAARPLHPSTTVSVISPGDVETDVHRHKSCIVRGLRKLMGRAQHPETAAKDILDGVFQSVDPERYRNSGKFAEPSPRCGDSELKLAVWEEEPAEQQGGDGDADPTHVLDNHAGTVSRLAPTVKTSRSEEEVAAIVRRARSSGRTVRVVGARHSYNDSFYSPSELLSLERFDEIGAIDEKGPTITIGAGVTVQALCDHLDARGFALRWAGNSGSQTLVGAAITGTHGYSRDDGLLAELIVGARVITGTGEILAIDDERELRALRVSLGTLCTITSVTLSLIPSGSLVRYSLSTLDEPDFLSRLCRDARSNEYFRFFPNRYHPERFSVLTINSTPETPPQAELDRVRYIDKTSVPRWVVALLRGLMRSSLVHRMLRRLPAPRLSMSLVTRFSTLLFVNAGIVNRFYSLSGLVYQAWNDDRTRNMELAIRPEDFSRFLRVFRRVDAAFRARTGEFGTYFTGRYTGGSDHTLLGPNHMRDVIFIDLHVRKGPHASEFLHELELELKDVLCVRPHWGKEFAPGHDDLAAAYPAGSWVAFRAAKRRYDRDNVFANAYTQRVFGW